MPTSTKFLQSKSRLTWASSVILLAGLLGSSLPLHAVVKNLIADYGAHADGVTNDRPAFAAAFSALHSGDTLFVPAGKYLVTLTSQTLVVPGGVSVVGQLIVGGSGPSPSHILLQSSAFAYFLEPGGDNVTVQGLTMERQSDFPLVMIPVWNAGSTDNFTLLDCTLIGNRDVYTSNYCHGIQVGSNTVDGTTISHCTMTKMTYGLFEQSTQTGTVTNLTVANCSFTNNYSSDLEFNSPNGTNDGVVVQNCYFADNQSITPVGGWAIGLCHIENVTVQNNDIENHPKGALHVESYSSNVLVSGNTLVGSTFLHNSNPIAILGGSSHVTLDSNHVDARGTVSSSGTIYLINATAGGGSAPVPTNVLVTNNVLVNSASTQAMYLQPGSFTPGAQSGNLTGSSLPSP